MYDCDTCKRNIDDDRCSKNIEQFPYRFNCVWFDESLMKMYKKQHPIMALVQVNKPEPAKPKPNPENFIYSSDKPEKVIFYSKLP